MTRKTDVHLRAIEAALDTIEAGLTGPLDLDRIAGSCGMSFWHFQRAFAAFTGEPVGSYIRRRRLSVAAAELVDSRRRILDIALDHQFESHSAFTRAFRTTFGLAPAAFRKHPHTLRTARPRLTPARLRHLQAIRLEPEVIECPPLCLVGLDTRFTIVAAGDTDSPFVLPRLWRRFMGRLGELACTQDTVRYGVCECVPETQRENPDELRYLAAVAVSPQTAVPPGMSRWCAPASRFARFVHRGPIERIGETINYIYAAWFPRSGRERGDGFDIERYDARFHRRGRESEIDYLVPLRS
jgi:AraC family transcriptional regulator